MKKVRLYNLGLVPYGQALDLQHRLVAERKEGQGTDTLILLEHPPVITIGRRGNEANILASPEVLQYLGIEVHRVERAGDVTYHGPGQLMGYPILDLRNFRQDVGWFVRAIQETIIRTLADFGIEGQAQMGPDAGVKVGGAEILAIGARVESWISFHGFAFYVDPIRAHFDLIVPCGVPGKEIVSMAQLLGRPVTVDEVRPHVARHFAEVFEVDLDAEQGMIVD